MERINDKIIRIFLCIILLIIIGCSQTVEVKDVPSNSQSQMSSEEMQNIKTLKDLKNKADMYFDDAHLFILKGKDLYNKFNEALSNNSNDIKTRRALAREHCASARVFYSKSDQEFQKSKSIWEDAQKLNLDKDIQEYIYYNIELSDVASKKAAAVYSACEYFEQSTVYYDSDYPTSASVAFSQASTKIEEANTLESIYVDYAKKVNVQYNKIASKLSIN